MNGFPVCLVIGGLPVSREPCELHVETVETLDGSGRAEWRSHDWDCKLGTEDAIYGGEEL